MDTYRQFVIIDDLSMLTHERSRRKKCELEQEQERERESRHKAFFFRLCMYNRHLASTVTITAVFRHLIMNIITTKSDGYLYIRI